MGKSKGTAQKTLDNAGQAELDLLRDVVVEILERLKVAEQVTRAILSKITKMQKDEEK